MRNISEECFVPTNVRMKFEDGSVSFCIQPVWRLSREEAAKIIG